MRPCLNQTKDNFMGLPLTRRFAPPSPLGRGENEICYSGGRAK